MICYAIYDDDSDENLNFESPLCLRDINIMEVLVNRWVPSQQREANVATNENVESTNKNRQKNLFELFQSFDDNDD